ncbi:response regulator transcription factor [Leifsonia sp. L25]|uniref:response regulator transcription factor n=1 Tax=Actinomycetes TaxID=1760 RepID=UPI003D697EB3
MSGRLLIVEDDPRLGPIMESMLSMDWEVQLCTSAEAALREATTTYYDVMVVDRRLPGMSGEGFVRALRHRWLGTPILMLTALGELHDRIEGLDAGANVYLVKPFEFDELRARFRALTRDYTGRSDGIEIGSWTFFPADHSVDSPYAGRIMLTETEAALLAVLAREPNRTFSREHLLSAVFERGERIASVETYVHYLRRKTDRELITTVRGWGYRLGTPA